MDCVLIHPGHAKRTYQALGSSLSAIETPIWCANIATYLRQHGKEVAIIDAEAEGLEPEAVGKRVNDLHPTVVGLVVYAHQPSASTHNMTVAGEIVRQLECPDVFMMGGHVSALPERTLREERCTYVIIGEGPETIRQFLEAQDPHHVQGLAYLDVDDHYIENPPAPLLSDLDVTMPMPAFDLLPMENYRSYNWLSFGKQSRTPYAAFYSTLGCPHACEFCAVQSPFYAGQSLTKNPAVNSYRFWSPARVGETLEHLVKTYGIYHVRIADEMFLLNVRHVEGICDEILKRGLDLNIYVYARADTCGNQALLEKMKKAGFNWVCIGFESAAHHLRASVGKTYTNETSEQAVLNLRNAGIHLLANFMVGLWEERMRDMEETFQYALAMKAEFYNLYCQTAYPGSPLYARAVKEGWPLPARWEDYSQHAKNFLPLPTKHVSAADVLKFRDEAIKRYFNDPGYLAKFSRVFGPDAVNDIKRMLWVSLERTHA